MAEPIFTWSEIGFLLFAIISLTAAPLWFWRYARKIKNIFDAQKEDTILELAKSKTAFPYDEMFTVDLDDPEVRIFNGILGDCKICNRPIVIGDKLIPNFYDKKMPDGSYSITGDDSSIVHKKCWEDKKLV